MDWTDEGIVLAARKHGETAAIVSVLTREHGRHPGLVRGGAGKRARGVLQPGNRVQARWRARLPEHLGTYTLELMAASGAAFLDDRLKLAGLTAALAVAETTLPEREAHAAVYEGLSGLLAALADDAWPAAYVRWEIALLTDLGYGLDLSRCAATGAREDLAYVSPKTGRAVSRAAGAPYRERLFLLPAFLIGGGDGFAPVDVANGLKLTRHFLEQHVYSHRDRGLPAARQRLEPMFESRD
ncbi:MAG: DNA repair protein RecO [Rhodospirillales bacterium]|nr:DNA repair protein RecO [Rhodospirillales bacterium]